MRPSVFPASLLARALLLGVAACCANPAAWGQAALTRVAVISTVAGNNGQGCPTFGVTATSTQLGQPYGLAVDAAGDQFISDVQCNEVFKVAAGTNIITLVAGGGGPGFGGDGGLATACSFSSPLAVTVDSAGNVYIDDFGNARIRKVTASSGIITTIAGTGVAGYNGDNQPAVSAEVNSVGGTAVDAAGNVYIADGNNNRIRKITVATGIITTVAGDGTAGFIDNVLATSGELDAPEGVAVDAGGNLYISDASNHRIRKVDAGTGLITTLAGNGTAGFSGDNGPGTSAELEGPWGMALDPSGNVYFSDLGTMTVREISASTGYIIPFAGNDGLGAGYSGDGGLATSAQLSNPTGVAFDDLGNLYIDDRGNYVMRRVNPTGGNLVFPSTPVATTSAAAELVLRINTGTLNATSFSAPASQGAQQEFSIATNTCALNNPLSNGTLCFLTVTFNPAYAGPRALPLQVATSSGNFNFGMFGVGAAPLAALTPGSITTTAGTGTAGYGGDGNPAGSAQLSYPTGVAVDYAGNQYISDYANHRIRRIDAVTGLISTFAGTGTAGYNGDTGLAVNAEISGPGGLVLDPAGDLYFVDQIVHCVRRVDAVSLIITTVAGNGTGGYSGDGGLATSAQLLNPHDLAIDTTGNIFITDTGNSVIREVNPSGIISTVAGNGTPGYSGDAGPAASAQLNLPDGIISDGLGNLFVTDTGNARIRKIDITGAITTVAGDGTAGFSGDGGLATSAEINTPGDVKTDPAGNVYFTDIGNQRVRKVELASGLISTLAGNGTGGYSGDGGPSTGAELNSPVGLAMDVLGNLLLTDTGNSVIRRISVQSGALSFATTTVGSTSSDSPQVANFSNIGNAALTFSVPSTGLNPSLSSSSFVLGSGSTCPQLTTSSSPATLTEGLSCTLSLSFEPAGIGAISGTVSATDDGLNGASTTQTVTMNGVGTPVATTTTVNTGTPTYGQTTVTATVAPVTGSALAVGSVVFTVDGAAQAAVTVNGAGVATMSAAVSNALAGGAHTVSAAYTSSSVDLGNSSGSTSITVAPAVDVVTTSISPASPTYGQTATVTVMSTAGGIPQSGSVGTVTVGSHTYSCTTGSTGQCTVQLPGGVLQGGMNTVTVTTAATANASAGGGSSTVTVAPAVTVLTASVNPATPVYGQAATVTVTAAAGGIPQSGDTGTVTVQGQTYTCTTNSLGQCTVQVPAGVLQGGNNTLTLASGASANAAAGSGSIVLAVTPAAAVVTAAISPVTPAYGQAATVTVTATAAGVPEPGSTGTVTVAGHSYTCTTNASGQCTVAVPAGVLQGGSDTVAVTTSATANAAAGSGSSSVTVTPVAPVVTASVAPASPTYGQAATITVTSLAAGFPVSGSTATVSVGGQNYTCTTTSSGQCTVQVPGGAVQGGNNTVTVAAGATANATAGSGSSTVTVAPATPVVTFSVSPAAPVYGQAASITVSVGAGSAFVAGSVLTVTVGGQTYTCTTNASGSCAITVPAGALTAGSDAFAVSTGATSDAVAGSASGTVTVAMATATLTLTSSAASVIEGAPVTFTATAVSGTSGVPSGTVTFYANGVAIGTGTLSGGVAALTLSTLPTGADAITAVYSGDVDFSAATAAAFTETVLIPSFTIAVASGAPPTASAAPGGTATFPLSLGTVNGFTGSLAMSATGLPPGATATFTPEDVVLSGPNAGVTTLSIVLPLTPPAATAAIRYGWLLLPLLLLPLRRKARLFCCALLLPLAMLAGLTGCGGGYYGQSATSYVVTVTASNGVISHSTTVTVTVQ